MGRTICLVRDPRVLPCTSCLARANHKDVLVMIGILGRICVLCIFLAAVLIGRLPLWRESLDGRNGKLVLTLSISWALPYNSRNVASQSIHWIEPASYSPTIQVRAGESVNLDLRQHNGCSSRWK